MKCPGPYLPTISHLQCLPLIKQLHQPFSPKCFRIQRMVDLHCPIIGACGYGRLQIWLLHILTLVSPVFFLLLKRDSQKIKIASVAHICGSNYYRNQRCIQVLVLIIIITLFFKEIGPWWHLAGINLCTCLKYDKLRCQTFLQRARL